MKVAQICSSTSWGGMEMHVSLLAEKLANRGHECTIFGAPESALFKDARNRSLNFKYFKPNGYFDPISIYKYSQIFKNSIDLVHVHYSKDLWTIVPALMPLHNVPLVFIKHVGTGKAKKDIFHRYLYHRVDHTIAISHVIKNNLIATHPISPENSVKLVKRLQMSGDMEIEAMLQKSKV